MISNCRWGNGVKGVSGWSYPGWAKVLALRDFKPLKPEQMIHQVHLWLGADGTEDQGAGFGFEDRERRPVPIPVLVSDFFRHHDLALLAHVNYGHSRKLPTERSYSNPFLPPPFCARALLDWLRVEYV